MEQGNIARVFSVLVVLVCSGCASYRIPLQTENHPANTDGPISLIELSPILDLDVKSHPEFREEEGKHH